MKFLTVFVATILCVTAFSNHHEEWSAFKLKHQKKYANRHEELHRFNVFQENLRNIEAHNIKYKNGKVGYFMGINKFADLTPQEFRNRMKVQKGNNLELVEKQYRKFSKNVQLPQRVDWREKGAVLKVKDEGDCKAYWTFAVTGALEAQNFIRKNLSVPLSEQEIIDCSEDYYNDACNTGTLRNSYYYVRDNGLQAEADYPYTDQVQDCKSDGKNSAIEKISEYKQIFPNDEDGMLQAVATIGPITTEINADLIQFYKGGIFDDYGCLNGNVDLNHAVLAVGYNLDSDTKYWIFKNSWGSDWGEKGYVRMQSGINICGIALQCGYPIYDD